MSQNTKVAAPTAIRATTLWRDATAVVSLELLVEPFADVDGPGAELLLFRGLELEMELEVLTPAGGEGIEGLEAEEMVEKVELDEGSKDETEDEVELPSEPTIEPVPQEILSPFGWVELVGGVVAPDASAIAKRVVQYVLLELGDLNW